MSREISVSLSHFLVRPRLVRFIVYLGANKGLLAACVLYNRRSHDLGRLGVCYPASRQKITQSPETK